MDVLHRPHYAGRGGGGESGGRRSRGQRGHCDLPGVKAAVGDVSSQSAICVLSAQGLPHRPTGCRVPQN